MSKFIPILFSFLFLQFWSASIFSQINQFGTPISSPIFLQSSSTPIGTTTYDLQTNRGVCRQVAVSGENVYATWTMSHSFDHAAIDRGTGFNVSNNQGDTWQAFPTERLEIDYKTGWSNIGMTESGRIFSISHIAAIDENAVEDGLVFSWQDEGEADWQSKVIEGDLEATWARAANDGEAIHVIAARSSNVTGINGIEGELHYFRSFDEGETWSDPMTIPNLSDYVSIEGIKADSYAIDVRGDVVAFVIGDENSPTILYKSLDRGDTWKVTVINEKVQYEWTVLSSGQFAVVIDQNDKVHVWYDRILTILGDIGTSEGYAPNQSCLMYWNESMEAAESQVLGLTVRMDYDGDGETAILIHGEGSIEHRSYGKTLVGHPSAGIDTDGSLYVAYSSMRDGAREIERPDRRLYRDIFLIKSTDGGKTWQGPYNVTDSPTTEDVFPSIQRNVGDFVHLVYQSDELTGTAVDNATSNFDIGQDEFVLNTIYHVKIPIEDIQEPELLVNTPPVYSPSLNSTVPYVVSSCVPPIEDFDTYVLDFPDGDLTQDVEVRAIFNNDYLGGFWLLSVSDSDGNAIIDSLFLPSGESIQIREDTLPPLIYGHPFVLLQGENLEDAIVNHQADEAIFSLYSVFEEVDVVIGTPYVDLGAEIFDEAQLVGCPPTLEVVMDSIDTSTISTVPYEIQYLATDFNGNKSYLNRYINVVGADLETPVILLIQDDPLNPTDEDGTVWEVDLEGEWIEPGFYAYDNVDGLITDKVDIGGDEVNPSEIGDYTIVYWVTDNAENSTVTTRVVRVRDATPPEVTLIGPVPAVVPCETPYYELGATAFDSIDGDLTNEIIIRIFGEDGTEYAEVCTCQAGRYIVEYSVSDWSGNVGVAERLVIIQGDCTLDCSLCFGSIEEKILQSNISIYPNPTSNHFFIDFKDLAHLQSEAQIEVYDVLGKLIYLHRTETRSTSNANQAMRIDLTNANIVEGVYFVKVQTSEGMIGKKIILQ